jgi:putative hemolysin
MGSMHASAEAVPAGTLGLTLHVLLLVALLALSAAFSGSEAVLFSLSPAQLEKYRAGSARLRRLVPRLLARPQQLLTTILTGNTAVNTLVFAVSYVFFSRLAEQVGAWVTPLSALVSVLLVVVFGEVVPKVIGITLADRLAPWCAAFVSAVSTVAGPVARLIEIAIARPCERLLWGRKAPRESTHAELTAEELKALLELSRRRGQLDDVETRFLREIIDFSATRVRDVMVPRVEVVAYDVDAPAEGLRDLMRQTRRKKVPVYCGSIDNIVGLVYAKVLFLNPDRKLRELLSPVHFVPELATCEHLLLHFRQTRTQLAIVVDEYGGMAGLVTLEDVLEQIVGELQTPEAAPEEPDIIPISSTEYDISGKLDVRYWAQTCALPPQAERVVTVGGLVQARLGRPAQVGDVVRLGNVEMQVTSLQRRRVHRLRLRLHASAPATEVRQ